jgi:hypothetical protein
MLTLKTLASGRYFLRSKFANFSSNFSIFTKMLLNHIGPIFVRLHILHRSDHCRLRTCVGILESILVIMGPAGRYLRYSEAPQSEVPQL